MYGKKRIFTSKGWDPPEIINGLFRVPTKSSKAAAGLDFRLKIIIASIFNRLGIQFMASCLPYRGLIFTARKILITLYFEPGQSIIRIPVMLEIINEIHN